MNFIPRFPKLIENLANIAIIATTCLLAYLVFSTRQHANQYEIATPQLTVGERLTVPGIDWGSHRKTYLFALQVGCRFCTASATQFRAVVSAASAERDVQVLAALPDDRAASTEYITGLGLNVPIVQVSMAALRVAGTPTVILCDSQGVVQRLWLGQLDSLRQGEIIKTLSYKG